MNAWIRLALVGAALASMFGLGASVAADVTHVGRNGAASARDLEIAKVAWRYFENNHNPETCLTNSVDGYPSTTMWDLASSLGGLVSAYELGVVDEETYHARLRCTLLTLRDLPLFNDELPNKAYDTRTATMANYANEPGAIGYSAIDLGRLLIWLRIVVEREPHYLPSVQAALSRWKFCNVLDRCGTLYGAIPQGERVVSLQEGRLGYEEYAAKGFQLWGFATRAASNPEPMSSVRIEGVDVAHDSRDPRLLGAHTYVVTESGALDGIELNWDRADDRRTNDHVHSDPLAAKHALAVYQAQEARHARHGILTARTEHHLDAEPWFVYDTVYSDGYPWNTITDDGRYMPAAAAVSTKAAFAMWALWDTPYTELLRTTTMGRFDPERGYYEGVFELSGEPIRSFTANTNGIILEAILYKSEGKILQFGTRGLARWVKLRPEAPTDHCTMPALQRTPCGPAEFP